MAFFLLGLLRVIPYIPLVQVTARVSNFCASPAGVSDDCAVSAPAKESTNSIYCFCASSCKFRRRELIRTHYLNMTITILVPMYNALQSYKKRHIPVYTF